MEDYVCSALSRGLKEIVFLEHMEAGVNYSERTWLTEDDFDEYFRTGRQLQKKYSDRIAVKLGVEVGYSPTHGEELLKRLAARSWDKIGLSYHFHKVADDSCDINLVSRKAFNTEAIKRFGPKKLLTLYYDTLIQAVKTIPATHLCHLDAGLRFQQALPFTNSHRLQISKILRLISDKGMALEINTSGFAIRDEQFPSDKILKEAIRLDIPLVCSSDAHRPEDVGRYFEKLPGLIKKLSEER